MLLKMKFSSSSFIIFIGTNSSFYISIFFLCIFLTNQIFFTILQFEATLNKLNLIFISFFIHFSNLPSLQHVLRLPQREQEGFYCPHSHL